MKFEDLYINDPHNKKNLQDLIDVFDKELFVPFIGAGSSIPLGEKNWGDLFNNLCDSLSIKRLRRSYKNGQVNYPRSFSRLFSKVNDQEMFYSHLFDHLDPTLTDVTGVHLKLVDLFDSYMTTNYDSPIEVAYRNQHKSDLIKHYFSPYGLHNFRNCVVYLHGHKDINFCVIKEEDYDYFYPSISNKPGFPILEKFFKDPHSRSKCNKSRSDLKRCFVAQAFPGPVVNQ